MTFYTDIEVEMAARASWAFLVDSPLMAAPWERLTEKRRDLYRAEIRAGLDAVLPAYLNRLADEWDDDHGLGFPESAWLRRKAQRMPTEREWPEKLLRRVADEAEQMEDEVVPLYRAGRKAEEK